MTSLTQVYVAVNRREAIQRGVNGTETPVVVELDVASMTWQDRDELAARLVLESDTYRKYPAPRLGDRDPASGNVQRIMTVNDPTQEGVIEALEQYRAAVAQHEADEQAVRDQAVALVPKIVEWIEQASEEELAEHHLLLCRNRYHACPIAPDCDERVRKYAYDAIPQEVIDPAKQRLRALEAREKAAKEAAQRAEAERKEQERRDWIAAHGSQRLVTMLAEGIGCEETYQRERARYDGQQFRARLEERRPGWELAEEDEIDRDVHDVPMRALRILAAGRQLAAGCKLAKRDGHYVCVDTFEGRLIVWPPSQN